MKIYGALEAAQLEQLSADPAGVSRGRIYFNTTTGAVRVSSGSGFSDVTTPVSPTPTIGVVGTRAAPVEIVAGTGIAPTYLQETQFIKGSGGAVDVSANPQISPGTTVGQTLKLISRSDTNTVLLEDGTGLSMEGAWLGVANSVIQFSWDGTDWVEDFRR